MKDKTNDIINIHDLNTQIERIKAFHYQAKIIALKSGRPFDVFDLDKAIAALLRRYNRHIGAIGKYGPHQNIRERNRRIAKPVNPPSLDRYCHRSCWNPNRFTCAKRVVRSK